MSRKLAPVAIVVIVVLAGLAWFLASGDESLEQLDGIGDFDLVYQLRMPGSPLGLAANDRELLAADRKGGVLRIRRDGRHLEAEHLPILQSVSVYSLTRNGSDYVAVTNEGFIVLGGSTLQRMTTKPAPELLGCLAWDGRFYWAATRKHTADQDVPALLYKLDRDFNVVDTSKAPGVGCQGMVFDGRHLWLADVFSDAITIVDITRSPPKVVASKSTPLSYLSGIALFEKEIWVTEYGNNRLYRLRPETRVAWAGSRARETQPAAMVQPAAAPPAKAVPYDRYVNSFATRPADDAEVLESSAELRAGAVYGAWRIWFGPDVFTEREQSGIVTVPQFARYTVTVTRPDGEKIEKVVEAVPGENAMSNVHLCDVTAPGDYQVGIFVHVQYVGADGGAKILNRSQMQLRLTAVR